MFATLRYDQNSTLVEQADYIMACTNCRARKLKCTGQKDGCNRCLSRGVECKYPEPAQGRGSRRAKAGLNKANTVLNTSTPSSHAPVRSPTTSKTPKVAASQQASHNRQRSQGLSNGASPVPSLTWTASSLSSDTNDRSMFDNPVSSDVSMNEAPDDFGDDLQLGNTDLFALDDQGSADLIWTNFFETGKQPDDPNSRSSPGSINFDPFSGFEPASNNFLNLSPPSSSISGLAETHKQIEGAGEMKISQQSGAQVSSPDTTSPTSTSKTPSSEIIQQTGPNFTGPNFFAPGMVEPATPPPSPHSQAPCRCFASALSLLEKLTVGDTQPCPPSVACKLHLKKRALVQCNKLLDCPHCSNISGFIVLLIVLCEKMISSYEQVMVLLTDQYDRIREQSASKPPLTSLLIQSEQERQMTVKDYDLDPDEEPCVLSGLALTQLKRLRDFLVRAKRVLKDGSLDPHVAMLESVEVRARLQLESYSRRADER